MSFGCGVVFKSLKIIVKKSLKIIEKSL
jgi:hypothetical protein